MSPDYRRSYNFQTTRFFRVTHESQEQSAVNPHAQTTLNTYSLINAATYPRVVMVTMVYQKAAGMLVNLLALEPFSA